MITSTPRSYLTPAETAVRLHGAVSERTIQRQLNAAVKDERGRVLSGPWAGAYRRGMHWRIPMHTLERRLRSVHESP